MSDERERHVGFAVKALNNQIQREMHRTNDGADKLTGVQNGILGMLAHAGDSKPVYQRDVEKRFNVRGATASGILKLLEQNGLICREPSQDDARRKRLRLTAAGRERAEQGWQNILRIEGILQAGIDPERLEIFFEVIGKMLKNLEEQEETQGI